MDVFWGVLFGVIAGLVLAWMILRVIEAQRGFQEEEFTGSEPRPDALAEHRATWDRSKEEGDPR